MHSDLAPGKFAYSAAIVETGIQVPLQAACRSSIVPWQANLSSAKGMEQTHHESDKFY